jgi:plastocyanin
MILRSSLLTLSLSACCVLGCKSPAGSPAASKPEAETQYTTIDNATAGVVSGTIHFSGTQPERLRIDMAQDPACLLSNPGTNLTEQYIIHDGKIANVFIYVKDGLNGKTYAPPQTPVVLDQKGCRYVPHVIGVMAGQPVEFRNSDPTMHNVHPAPTTPGNNAFDISQPPMGGTTQKIFARPELMLPVRCNNHPWMSAFINVAANPFYAVSGSEGHYQITGLPPGTYTVTAAHEKLGTSTAQVTVQPQQTATTDFTFNN